MSGGRVVVLTGAGISAESGLATFRDSGGLWAQMDLAEVATPQAYRRDPAKVLGFYDARRKHARAASPNAAHRALVRLEEALGDRFLLVTQNVDALHERAGSERMIHMHGELEGALCARCDARWPAPAVMQLEDRCPECGAETCRPDIVWFGEIPYRMDEIAVALDRADLFVSIGTSGTVYPAAGFVTAARASGAHTVELNLEASAGASMFHETRQGEATSLVPAWVDELLSRG